MSVNGQNVQFQVDSGATCNINPKSYLNTNNVITLGKCNMKFINTKNRGKYKADFVVLDGPCQPILGSKAPQALRLIKVQKENIL